MPFDALTDDGQVWAFDHDEESWRALEDAAAAGTLRLRLRCCGGEAVPARGIDGVPHFRHRPGSPCPSAAGVLDDLFGGGEASSPESVLAVLRWAVDRAGWRADDTASGVLDCRDDRRRARIVVPALAGRACPRPEGHPALWVLTRGAAAPDGVAHDRVLRLQTDRPAVVPGMAVEVLSALRAFLDAVAARTASREILPPVPVGRPDPCKDSVVAAPERGNGGPDGEGSVREEETGFHPDEFRFAYLHLPNRPPILTAREREKLWGVPVTRSHPEACFGACSNDAFSPPDLGEPGARTRRRRA